MNQKLFNHKQSKDVIASLFYWLTEFISMYKMWRCSGTSFYRITLDRRGLQRLLRLVAGVLCKDNTRTLHKLIKARVTGEQVTASSTGQDVTGDPAFLAILIRACRLSTVQQVRFSKIWWLLINFLFGVASHCQTPFWRQFYFPSELPLQVVATAQMCHTRHH